MREFDAHIDWDYPRNADLLLLEYACKLLFWKDPYSWPEISHLTHSHPAWTKAYNLAIASIKRRKLSYEMLGGKPAVPPPEFFLRWAPEKGFTTPPKLADIASPRPAGWPWGKYETELLHHLAAAVNKFWKNYDPSDPTTAPTNDQVIDWLVEQGVSKTIASAIATILHADGLPRGPRKK